MKLDLANLQFVYRLKQCLYLGQHSLQLVATGAYRAKRYQTALPLILVTGFDDGNIKALF